MNYKKGDFHIHSNCSDGALTPKEILDLAKKRGIDIISITDHNSTDGLEEAIQYGNNIGIKVVPGIELSTRYFDTRVHVLGYFKNDGYKNKDFQQILKCVREGKINEILSILASYINIYRGKKKLDVEKGIEMLKVFGATVVLAHPVFLKDEEFNSIINMNFDGIEAKYFYNTDEQTKKFIDIANSRNLIYTAGSDFHRTNEMYRSHGTIGDVYLEDWEILKFLKRLNI